MTVFKDFLLNTTTWRGTKQMQRAMTYAFDNAYMKPQPKNEAEHVVFSALDTAINENGYTFAGMTARDIADDLNRFAYNIDTFDIDDVVKAVEAYFNE